MSTYRFEKLRVYNNTVTLVEQVYSLSRKLPKSEQFALVDQLKRSSTSIVLNIAEGTGSKGDVEFKNFLRHALKSLYETVAALKLTEKLFKVKTKETLQSCETVGKELNALINSLSSSKKAKD